MFSSPQAGPPLLTKLLEANRNAQAPTSSFSIDIIPLLINAVGNPTWFSAKFSRTADGGFHIGAYSKDKPIASASLYRDPQRGGTYFSPEIDPLHQHRGLGTVLYLIAGRLLWIDQQALLNSNPHSLTPKATRRWDRFCDLAMATKFGHKSYQLTRGTVEDEQSALLLRFALKSELNAAYIRSSAHVKRSGELPPLQKERFPLVLKL